MARGGLEVVVLLFGVLCGVDLGLGTSAVSTGPFLVDLEVPDVIYDGQQIQFNCSADVGVASVSWLLDDMPLPGEFDVQLNDTVTVSWNGSCLTCRVVGNDSSVANASEILTVASTSPTLVEFPESRTVNASDSLVLTCRALGLPTPSVCWKRNGLLLGPTLSLGSASVNVPSVSDENAGNYTCTATNAVGTVTSPVLVVIVTSTPVIATSPPPEGVDVLNGTDLVLTCVVRGNPPPTLTWAHNGENLEPDSRVSILANGTLVITMVMLVDAGFYQCIATNELGSDQSDMIIITVLVFPTFIHTPSPTTVDLDDPTGLVCVASGIPEVDYFWFRSLGGRMVPVELDDRVMENNGSLNITMATREDTGDYVCVAGNDVGNVTSPPAQLTVRAVPIPPEDLRATAVGSSWVSMEWNENTDNTFPLNSYILEYKLPFEPNWTPVTVRPPIPLRNVSSLYPSATYQFRVQAKSTIGVSDMSAIVNIITGLGAPVAGLLDQPEQVQAISLSPRSLNISWSIPQVLQQTSYLRTLLTVHSPTGIEVLSVEIPTPSALSSALTPATNYSITITLVFRGDHRGTPVTQLATTMEGVPGDAPNVMTSVALGPRSVRVTWAPPTMANGEIIGYTIYYSPPPSNVTVVGGALSRDLDGLSPFTEYSIRLSASTSAGEGPLSAEGGTTVLTYQDVPLAPSGVSLTPLNSTAIQVTWDAFAVGTVPGVLVNFTVSYNRIHHGGHRTSLEAGPDDTRVELGGLVPFTEYCVRVRAATEAGPGPFTRKVTTRTLGDVPGASVDGVMVMEVCPAGGLLVQWTPPNPRLLGGPVEEVEYFLSFSTLDGTPVNTFFSYNASITSYLLEDNVMPFTNYTVQLALRNQNGTGQPGTASATSCDAAAQPPVSVMVQATSSSSIEVTWSAPLTIPGVLRGYVVRYGRDDVLNSVNISATSDPRYVIENLEPFTNYMVGVATQTRGPLGSFRNSSVLTLSAAPVEAVLNVSVQAACPSNLLVQWIAPQRLTAPANQTHYLVSYNSTPGEVMIPYADGPMANLTGLQLDMVYSVAVMVVNSNGTGPSTALITHRTMLEGVAMAPSNVTVVSTNSSALTVTWVEDPAPIPSYSVFYHLTNTADLSQPGVWPNISSASQSRFSAVVDGLDPFTNYSIVVMATSECGGNQSEVITGVTGESLPTIPVDLMVTAMLPTKVEVQWSSPASPNGIVTHYNVYCPSSSRPGRVIVTDMLTYECDGLDTDTQYTISVTAINGAGEGPAASSNATTTCSLESGRITLPESCSASTDIVYVLVVVVVSKRDRTFDEPRYVEQLELEELLQLNKQYFEGVRGRVMRRQISDGGGIYIAANLTLRELPGFELGDNSTRGEFTNYPLLPDRVYNVTLRGTVSDSDAPIYYTSEETFTPGGNIGATESSTLPLIPIAAGAGAALLIILLICMATLISCVCCCCNRSLDKVDGVTGIRIERTGSFRLSKKKFLDPVDDFRANNKTEVLEDHPPVPVLGFINKLMVMRTNDNQLFLEEFGSIPMTMPHLSTDVASLHVNKVKNRYNNILPYDITRVKLRNGDYINANYCSGHRKTKAYIATQGPVQETLCDFWRMVWEENVHTIVMLTNTQEKGKIKCEMYWPREIGSSSQHGNLDVSLASVTTLADYSIRKFAMQKVSSSKEPREVVQFHFTSWPDHGVPQYATAMLAMLRRVRSHYSVEEGPMLVHCSAGVGRTGTFIVIDTMLQRLTHEDEMLDIYGHVSLLRSQRNYMIQTEDQYFFVHEAIAEALLCGNTEVSLDSLPGYVETLYAVIPDDDSETTNLELQFKRLALERNDPHRWMTANKDANKTKNRFVNVLPYDSSRVCLEYSPGVDGSDYINASHVDSYHKRRAYIATQGPLASTVVDFWRMLWQYSVPVVVMLTEEMEKGRECSAGYWPGAILHPISYGDLSVELNVERNSGSYSYRDLCVTNAKENKRRLVRQFQFHGWPEVGVPSPAVLIEFIREVQKLCQSLPQSHGPVVVHCSNGVGRTGVFLSLDVILERMLVEGLVDVFQTVKNLRIQRPAMVQTLEQYHLCYDAALTYLLSSEFLPPIPQQPLLTRQRGSSQRGSRHGSHSSAGSRKKSKNTSSPSLSPARSLSQRNTPMRSESFKESPHGTIELKLSGTGGGGGAQVYGGSDATSTFGSHVEPTNSQPSVQVYSDGVQHHTLPTGSSPMSGGPGSTAPDMASSVPMLAASVPNAAPQGAAVSSNGVLYVSQPPGAHNPVSGLHYAPVPTGSSAPYGGHTPVMAASRTPVSQPPAYGDHTPVLAASHSPAYGDHTPVPTAHTSHGPAYGDHTPVPTAHTSHGPAYGGRTPVVAHTAGSFLSQAYGAHTPVLAPHAPMVSGSSVPGAGTLGYQQSQSPIPAGLDMTPQVFAGSQSSMFTGSQTPGFGSQTLSLLSGSQTPPMSHSLSPNLQNGPPPHMNTHHYHHQLLETQRHAPNSLQLPDRAVGAESTP